MMPYPGSKAGFYRIFLFLFTVLQFITLPIHGSDKSSYTVEDASSSRLAVFLDCPWWCDTDFIQQEIALVNYVRDKELAQVHVMISRHGGGSAGTTYLLIFLGQKQYAGMINELSYWAPGTNTADANRRGYTNMLKIGLAPYISRSNMADYVRVEFTYDPKITRSEPKAITDPWKNWIFEITGGGNFSKEEKSSNMHLRFNVTAEKVTHEWKYRFRPYFNYTERVFITGTETIKRVSHRNGFSGHAVKSINDHWSAGLFSSMLSSTFHNLNFNAEIRSAIQYSLYPYQEATRRSIDFTYRFGGGLQDYMEETIFEKTEEFLFGHSIAASAYFQQPWGTVRAGISGSHYLHDFRANRAALYGIFNLRLFQGFAISFSGNFDLINDLVALPKGDMALEDILLQQRRQSTNYQMSGAIGITYTFGSEFTGVYNPRL